MIFSCFTLSLIVLPGVGKTTVVQKACEALMSSGVGVEGFYTEEVREGSRRVGFDVVTVTGERGQLSRIRYQGHPIKSTCSLLSVLFSSDLLYLSETSLVLLMADRNTQLGSMWLTCLHLKTWLSPSSET